MPVPCDIQPPASTILRGNKCHVLQKMSYFEMSLNDMFEQYEGYGFFNNVIQWDCERIIWIGFFKNVNTDCLFYKLSKDIVKYVISFLKLDNVTIKFKE